MYGANERHIEKALQSILLVLNRTTIPESEKRPLREDFQALWEDIQMFRSDAAYVQHIAQYVSAEHQRRVNPDSGDADDGNDGRERPLCGCSSPTCALKRGELPAPARTREGGVVGHLSAEQAVANTIQRHRDPYVLQEADRDWWETTGEPLSQLLDLKSRAESIEADAIGPHPGEHTA